MQPRDPRAEATADPQDLLSYDDGSLRPWRHPDADEREALERTHEARVVGGRDVYIPREADEDAG